MMSEPQEGSASELWQVCCIVLRSLQVQCTPRVSQQEAKEKYREPGMLPKRHHAQTAMGA